MCVPAACRHDADGDLDPPRGRERPAVSLSRALDGGYLASSLSFSHDRITDATGKAVMMRWEEPLMRAHAAALCCGAPSLSGSDVLNIGFGMGLFDEAAQALEPRSHTIVEAHPDVWANMHARGWASRPRCALVFGRWQEALPRLGLYDAIFYDTFGEGVAEFDAFCAVLPALLRPGGRFSFFNGFCAHSARLHTSFAMRTSACLGVLGLRCRFQLVPCEPPGEEGWRGVSGRYWTFDSYMLPVATLDEPSSVARTRRRTQSQGAEAEAARRPNGADNARAAAQG
eukprot:CAMPEP_0202755546 /NCGR_PEP_ID=MMETSP1388-20130828/15077_1 /ASSEMBLY_ACC=CAM_ASM_000864 /TAXON_ID=37098 /ORGANISM="Isochrysis sp, Strain CCMP1244" /LENGTH=284 /DNA_ID=CAMNT_0049423361 /DNA_START=128 /DNA_END=983 /DNA_ORIENTATION=-